MSDDPVSNARVGRAIELYVRHGTLGRQLQRAGDELSSYISTLTQSELIEYMKRTHVKGGEPC